MDYTFIVSEEEKNQRLDVYLHNKLLAQNISRSQIQKLISNEKVLIDGVAKTESHYKVKQEESIVLLEIQFSLPSLIKAEPIPLNIIYEDECLIVIDKPVGMVVHPAAGNYSGTLLQGLLAHCQDLSTLNPDRPGIVHRLDKGTSGLLVVAKDNQSHQNLAGQFKNRKVLREYIILVKGIVRFDEGIIEQPIGRDVRNRQKMSVVADGKEAKTEYKVIQRYKEYTLLRLNLKTGRTHQIRVHFAYLGYPVAGDKTYGGKEKNPPISRQAVHASRLGFYHPKSREFVEFVSPLPKDMEEAINKLQATSCKSQA
ncbi:MAG: RluA family pseudouridine synthase [Candidatus Omnitrophica bacterium]|nr:RluA family pseudouridine synthase [Candidatus Omnitrophota bacterium]